MNQIGTIVADNQPMPRERISLMEQLRPLQPRPHRLVIRSGGRTLFVEPQNVDWVEAEGNYVRLHVGEGSHLIRNTMHAMEAGLGGERFVRIHRSRIANIESVQELRVASNGEYEVVLRTGRALRVSRLYRERVQARLRRS